MPPLLVLAAMFGLAVAGSACIQSNPSAFVEREPLARGDFPGAVSPNIPAPAMHEIDLHDFKIYGTSA